MLEVGSGKQEEVWGAQRHHDLCVGRAKLRRDGTPYAS